MNALLRVPYDGEDGTCFRIQQTIILENTDGDQFARDAAQLLWVLKHAEEAEFNSTIWQWLSDKRDTLGNAPWYDDAFHFQWTPEAIAGIQDHVTVGVVEDYTGYRSDEKWTVVEVCEKLLFHD